MAARLEHGDAPTGDAASTPPTGRRTLASSAAVMASGTLVSRMLGLVRNALLVAVVGVVAIAGQDGSMADAWSVANKLPNIISMLLAGGILNAVLVPQVVRAMRRRDGGEEHVNRLLTVAILVLLGVTIVLTAAASLLITLYAASFPPEWKAVAVALAYWCIPQLFFYGLYTLLGQVLNARSVFGPYMWAPAVNNVVAIAGLVAFLVMFGGLPDGGLAADGWTSDRITLLAGSATLGVVAQALVLVIPLYRSGFRFRPVWGIRGHGLGTASTVAMWAFAALAVGQVGFLAVSNVAAAASSAARETGEAIAGNFAYDNAFLIFMLPQSLVTVSLVTALFTRLSGNAAARDGAKVRDDLSLGLRTLGVFTVFATAAFAVLAIPLVQLVLLDRADFPSYRAVGAVLVAMSFGLIAMAVWTMVQRIFYAYEDTRTLFHIQIPMAIILALGSVLSWWLLEPQWWVVGAGAATALSNTVGATVGYLATRKYLPNLDGARVLRTYLRVVMAVLPVALVGWGALHLWGLETSFLGALLRVLVIGGAMLAGYLVLIRALRVSELDELLARVSGPLHRVARRLPAPLAAMLPRTMSESGGGEGRGDLQVSTGSSVSLGAGETLASRYRLDRPAGGDVPHAAVWSGTDTVLGADVRVLLLDGPHRDHAIDAARRAALVADPRLPTVLRAGVEDGQGYIVTESCPGVTLADLLRGGPLPPSQARALVGEAAAALATARRRGVYHLALRPGALVRTDSGAVRVLGIGTEAAARGIDLPDSQAAARRDAVGLVNLLYAALTGTWPGAPELADGLPAASTNGADVVPAGDVVGNVPNDLDTLCAVTMGEHDDGPRTAAELVSDLAPWGAIDVAAPAGPLPPVLAPVPGESVRLPVGYGPRVAEAAGGDGESPEGGDDAATAIHSIDTSAWAPHPLPSVSEPTPFADLVADTGTLPVVRALPLHAAALREHRSELTMALPAAPAEAPVPESTPAEATVGGAASAAVEQAEPAATVDVSGLPMLTRQPRGWDVPGGTAPERLPEAAGEPDEPSPAMRTGTERPGAAAAGGAPAGLGVTATQVVGSTRLLLHGAGERIGTITGRASAYVGEVRDEFRPVEPEDDDDGRSRFNPAPIALCVMIALVIFGLVMALLTLKDASTAFTPGPNPGDVPPAAEEPTPTQQPTTPPPTTAPEGDGETEGDGPPPASGVPIAQGVTYDPTVTGGENQPDAFLAYDGNPDTTWNSLRYNSATYGMKDGLGYTVVLEEEALVSSVTLDVKGEGGMVEIRVADPQSPDEGTLLASGAMGSSVTYTFAEPVAAETIALWFPELPAADSDGRNRIELAEIRLG